MNLKNNNDNNKMRFLTSEIFKSVIFHISSSTRLSSNDSLRLQSTYAMIWETSLPNKSMNEQLNYFRNILYPEFHYCPNDILLCNIISFNTKNMYVYTMWQYVRYSYSTKYSLVSHNVHTLGNSLFQHIRFS